MHKLKGAAGNLALSRVCNICTTIETELSTKTLEEIKPTLDQLADELMNVTETLGEFESKIMPSEAISKPVEASDLLPLLLELDKALAHGELAETVLSVLSKQLPKQDFDALDQIVNSFDFEAARAMVNNLHDHYRHQGNAKGNTQ